LTKVLFIPLVVAPHLQQYQSLFGYYASETKQKFEKEIPLFANLWIKKAKLAWIVGCSFSSCFIGCRNISTWNTTIVSNDKTNQELGTYDNPEEAFKETQKGFGDVIE
jgi:hypothetical protein